MLYNVTNNFLFPALSGAFCLCRSRPLPLYSHRISSIFSLFLYIYVHAFDVFILKPVPALKLIPSLCITDEGQTERQRGKVKVVSSKGCSSIITRESSDQQNEADKERKKVERQSQAPAQIVHCYSQLHPACFVQFLANLKIVADMLI